MRVKSVGSGPATILIHGAFSDSRVWEPQYVLGTTRTLHLVDLTGYHPDCSVPESICASTQVDELIELLDNIAEPAVLVGHSRGGRLAMEVAARSPERVERLVLIEPGGVAEQGFYEGVQRRPAPFGDPRADVSSLVAKGMRSEALQLYIDHGHGAGTWAGLSDRFREVACDNAHTIEMMIRDSTVPMSRNTLARVRCPTLLMLGTQSPPVFAETAAVLERCVEELDVTDVESDHFMTHKAAESCNREMIRWLSKDAGHVR